MVRLEFVFLLLTAAVCATFANEHTGVGESQSAHSSRDQHQPINHRALKGKFLHISDIHVDPYYRPGAKANRPTSCHRGTGHDKTGYYGAPLTRCDSPLALVDATFQWIKENIRDDIDFVIYTGDSVRHDNDDKIPRSNDMARELNEYVAQKFVDVFGKTKDTPDDNPADEFVIPIVPTIGNNDIIPHNIFLPGPNTWTQNFLDIWKHFIPEAQEHSFARGGWFWTEVIPNKLVVISLNSLYFFNSNAASFGCNIKESFGYEHLEWLRIQLQFIRENGMKAIMIGHVPPTRMKQKHDWPENCYQKYILWLRQYRDVIVGSFYGHMNVDHFIFHDIQHSRYKLNADDAIDVDEEFDKDHYDEESLHGTYHASYLSTLRSNWARLPNPPEGVTYGTAAELSTEKKRPVRGLKKFLEEIGGSYGERFSMSFVSPSIVPNYLPTLRIVEYNITGLAHDHPATTPQGRLITEEDLKHQHSLRQEFAEDGKKDVVDYDDVDSDIEIDKKKKKKKGKKGKGRKGRKQRPKFPVPYPPSKTLPPGPAYSPQTMSLLSWTQFYANLTLINKRAAAKKDLLINNDAPFNDGYGHGHFEFEVEYTTGHSDVYNMTDLTVRHWLGLAKDMSLGQYPGPDGEQSFNNSSINYEDFALDVIPASSDDGSDELRQNKISYLKLKDNKLWYEFLIRAFSSALPDSELEKEFG